jgi:hypothetical protein
MESGILRHSQKLGLRAFRNAGGADQAAAPDTRPLVCRLKAPLENGCLEGPVAPLS